MGNLWEHPAWIDTVFIVDFQQSKFNHPFLRMFAIAMFDFLRSNANWHVYLDNPPVQNYRSKSETAIIIADCLNFRRFQFFLPFQFAHFDHFGLLIFFRRFVGLFRRFVGFFRRFKIGKHM